MDCPHCLHCKTKNEKKKSSRPVKYPVISGIKECSKCHEKKSVDEFNKLPNNMYKSYCKKCRSSQNASYYKLIKN